MPGNGSGPESAEKAWEGRQEIKRVLCHTEPCQNGSGRRRELRREYRYRIVYLPSHPRVAPTSEGGDEGERRKDTGRKGGQGKGREEQKKRHGGTLRRPEPKYNAPPSLLY